MENSYGWHRQEQQEQPLPLHLCFFLLITFLLVSMSWYLNYESALESLLDHVKLMVALSPLVLLVVVHWLSAVEPGRFPLFIPLLERESLQFSGGSPWGVALALVLLLFMVSYQSYFHEHWFPSAGEERLNPIRRTSSPGRRTFVSPFLVRSFSDPYQSHTCM